MDINWKVITIFGIIGFFLSFLVGIISGVSFATILLRGLISGVLFGGVGFGITVVIGKFLPELQNPEGAGSEGEDFSGEGIDIVIEDDTPLMDEVVSSASSEGHARSDSSDAEDEDGFVEEVEESAHLGGRSSETDDQIEDIQTVENEESEVSELMPMNDESGIDSLPDIGEFSNTFSSGGEEPADSEPKGSSGLDQYDGSSTVDVMGKQQDTRVIAKAVQTMMKKE